MYQENLKNVLKSYNFPKNLENASKNHYNNYITCILND